jgi:hypothetical protein
MPYAQVLEDWLLKLQALIIKKIEKTYTCNRMEQHALKSQNNCENTTIFFY